MIRFGTTSTVTLELPIPPSANALFRNVPKRGRVKTSRYEAWLKEAGWLLKSQRPEKIIGPYHITIAVAPSRHDLGNLEKATSDLLQAHQVIENDGLAASILITRDTSLPPRTIKVVVKPTPDERPRVCVKYPDPEPFKEAAE
jgi:Holliday junction resolvase RusA-like endonuclease